MLLFIKTAGLPQRERSLPKAELTRQSFDIFWYQVTEVVNNHFNIIIALGLLKNILLHKPTMINGI